jgi:hypothetical protein
MFCSFYNALQDVDFGGHAEFDGNDYVLDDDADGPIPFLLPVELKPYQTQYNEFVSANIAIEELAPIGSGRYRVPLVISTATEDVITTEWPDGLPVTGSIHVEKYMFCSVISRVVAFGTSGQESAKCLVYFCNCR